MSKNVFLKKKGANGKRENQKTLEAISVSHIKGLKPQA